ncbi:hypothetical protein G6F63_014752 [Rhizopus arrhizus]|nr:hypothetical protein G6F63_014752 [Rhizopus arrhizus]
MHGVAAVAALLPPGRQRAGARISAQGADFMAVAMHCVQHGQRRMRQEIRGVDQAADDLRQGQRAVVLGVIENADAFATGMAFPRGAGTDVDVHGTILGLKRKRPCAPSARPRKSKCR